MNYPIGIQDFAKLRENNFVYVDKTDMVFDISLLSNIILRVAMTCSKA